MHAGESVASSPMPALLTPDDLPGHLAAVPQWSQTGAALSRTFAFTAYLDGITFVNEVAALAEEANHHPDIVIGWRKVTLTLSTHSKGGLTKLDFCLARKIDGIAG